MPPLMKLLMTTFKLVDRLGPEHQLQSPYFGAFQETRMTLYLQVEKLLFDKNLKPQMFSIAIIKLLNKTTHFKPILFSKKFSQRMCKLLLHDYDHENIEI